MSRSPGAPGGPPEDPPVLRRGVVPPAVRGPARAAAQPEPEVPPDVALAAGLPWQGELAETSPLRFLALAAATQATGRLVLHGKRASYTLFLRRGTPEHASSSSAEDDLGAHLVARGAVEGPALAAAQQRQQAHGGDLVENLATLGALNPAESFRFLQEHAVTVLARALGTEHGAGYWEPHVPLPPSSFPLGGRFALLCDAVRRLDAVTIRRRLGPQLQRVARRVGGRVELGDLRLSALEARAVGLLDGTRSVAELAAAYPAEAEVIHRAVFLLAECELVSFGEERAAPETASAAAPTQGEPTPPPARTSAPTPTPTPAPPQPAAARAAVTPPPVAPTPPPVEPTPPPIAAAPPRPPPPPPKPARVEPARAEPVIRVGVAAAAARSPEEALRALADRLAGATDHFQVLGVTREAPLAATKSAYFTLAKQVHPDAAASGEAPELKRLRADLFARVSEAWGVLSDDGKRKRYLAELAEGAAVDVAAILEAEQVFVKATALVKARQYEAALAAFTQAIAMNPDEPEFAIWKAWVEFLVASDRKARHPLAAAAIDGALKKSPRCMKGYLFLGQMAKLVGDLSLAERHLRRGLDKDPENIELERELKYLRK